MRAQQDCMDSWEIEAANREAGAALASSRLNVDRLVAELLAGVRQDAPVPEEGGPSPEPAPEAADGPL